jgi:Rieske Fe-S protein
VEASVATDEGAKKKDGLEAVHHDVHDGRRGALKALCALGGVVATAVVAVPGARMLASGVKGGGGVARWVKTVRYDSLADGAPKRVSIVADHRDAWMLEKSVELGAVWLIRKGKDIDCFSVVCPHLGCSVAASPGGGFNCPCHDSDFGIDGARKTGPSPRDMDRLTTKVEDGYVLVDFRNYRQGTPDKIEIG